ncbi:mechanosensitive ion channel family protein [Candidatus Bipolaricaulota bacterium]|nr:mechanosensitive ion channel family protein [Candidatus Bipolaricaulota bacterium]
MGPIYWHTVLNPATVIGGIFYALLFLAIAWSLNRLIRKGIRTILLRDREERIDRTAVHFVTKLVHIAVYLLAFLFFAHLVPAIRHFGTALLAGFGLVSVVLALAAQNTLGNIIAGIAILLYRPFKAGDTVQLQAPSSVETGTLETLGLGYTIARTFDNRRIIVPNSLMAAQTTVNLSDPRMMAIVSIGLDYASDVERARAILTEIAGAHPLVREIVGCPVAELSSSGVVLSLRAWCDGVGDAAKVRSDLYEQAKTRYDQESIGIANASTNVVVTMQPSG